MDAEKVLTAAQVSAGLRVWQRGVGYLTYDEASAAILAALPPDWCGHEAEIARLRAALVEAVMPLEVIAGQDRSKPYAELSRDFMDVINEAIGIARAALGPQPA